MNKSTIVLYEDILFKIRINKLLSNNITIEEFFICFLLYKKELYAFDTYIKQLGDFSPDIYDSVVKKKFCKPINDKVVSPYSYKNIVVTEKFVNIVVGESYNVEDWFEDWFNLFPKGIKSGGYYIRGDKKYAKNKMKRFVMDYPEYSIDTIMNATTNYLNRMKIDGYKYCKLSHYFISKDDNSTLASECEQVDDIPVINNDIAYGEDEL